MNCVHLNRLSEAWGRDPQIFEISQTISSLLVGIPFYMESLPPAPMFQAQSLQFTLVLPPQSPGSSSPLIMLATLHLGLMSPSHSLEADLRMENWLDLSLRET